MEGLLLKLADALGVKRASAGEAITPRFRAEQPLPQGPTILFVLFAVALIIWLYRREGKVSTGYKMLLAGLRITLVLLGLFMLSETVLSVDRTGLPFFVIMVDDSASAQVTDQYSNPKTKQAAESLAKAAGSEVVDRVSQAKGWLLQDRGAAIRELVKQHRVRIYLVSSGTRPLVEIDQAEKIDDALKDIKKIEASGEQTRLGTGVLQVLTEMRGTPPTAILLLTDGQTTDGEALTDAAKVSARKGVPLYAIGLGDAEAPRDLELTELLVDDVVFVDDLVRFQPRLISRGFEGQQLTLRLLEKDTTSADPKAEREIERKTVIAPPDNQPSRLEITHRPKKTGAITYIVEIVPMERELSETNNRIERVVNVREEKLKVLIVEGEPRYEFRYLKTFLQREKSIDLRVVLLSADPEYSNQDLYAIPTFPAVKDDLFAYDVVIVGDADPSNFSAGQMANLAEFVTEKGGGVLFIAGDNFNPLSYRGTPLEVLLPIELADARNPTAAGNSVLAFRPNLTAEGRSSPIFRFGDDEVRSAQIWSGLPESLWFFEAPRKKPAALVLAEHPTQAGSDGPIPIFLYQFVGSGKTMFNAVDDTWRWRTRVGDKYFGRFWLQSIRFLARSKLLGQKQAEVLTDRRRYQRGEPIVVRVRFPNPAIAPASGDVSVQLSRLDGKEPRKYDLKATSGVRNLFEGLLPPIREGDHVVKLLPPPVLQGEYPSVGFRVDPPAGERENVQMNEPELVRATQLSGGSFFKVDTAAELFGKLPKPQKVPLDTDPPIELWNTWPILAAFLTILTLEWVLRKRKQLI